MSVDNPHDRFFKETFSRIDILVDVIAIFRKISNRTGEIAMSTAERLINEGLEKGLAKGVRALLTLGMDVKSIAAALDVPVAQVSAIIESIKKA